MATIELLPEIKSMIKLQTQNPTNIKSMNMKRRISVTGVALVLFMLMPHFSLNAQNPLSANDLLALKSAGGLQISPDGTEVRQFKNGTRTFKMPSGQSVVNYPDGSRVQTNVDGTIITLRTDGVQVANLPNGVVNTKYPDGHVVQIDPDGTKVERLVEGVIVTYTPGGIVIARFKDGRTVQRNCDGVKLETFPDGRVEQTSVCGRFVTVKTADGKVTTKRLKPGVLEGSAVDEILGKDE